MLKTPGVYKPIIADKAVPWAEQGMGIKFAQTQSDALKMALTEKVSIITGGPGVGKTTIIQALVDVFTRRKLSISLGAPTGRAAKRMEEATRMKAMTIHRMLKYQPRTHQFEHNRDNPLEEDIFILDEVSMIDIQLMNSLLAALPDESCLILVGDIDQLPSVGPGNVLRDLIGSGSVPYQKLDTIFRQETGGWIVQNAHHVNRGEKLELPPQDEEFSDFYFIETKEPEQVIQRMINVVTNRIPDHFGFDPTTEIQVLTPMRKNLLGSENLNAVLQEAINPEGLELSRYGRKYRMGDRVMQIRNNYDKDIYNGDIGHIVKVDLTDDRIHVDYDGRRVIYELTELDELVHAYACSIHKSQGSEYPAVVILITTQHFKMLQRNLLYTGITRGRKLVCLIGSSKAVYMAICNNEIRLRRTGLRKRLKDHGTMGP
jgi:exodeoxyribonuclease V alpha subunit